MLEKHMLVHSGEEPHLFREIMLTHQALLNVFTRKVGMTSARLALLRLLAICTPEKLGVMEASRHLGINAAAVVRQLKEMEKDRLVERLADARDRRRSYVRLTEQGWKVFELVHERAHEFERTICGPASAEEVATAVRVLARVRAAIETLG
ncbi:MAG TPA: MarR family transcriptional regulator [Syntrophobacteraceae bacterium]|nr:MarR family transcriptional regulator [Syntrophobacteraceae bacterium]